MSSSIQEFLDAFFPGPLSQPTTMSVLVKSPSCQSYGAIERGVSQKYPEYSYYIDTLIAMIQNGERTEKKTTGRWSVNFGN